MPVCKEDIISRRYAMNRRWFGAALLAALPLAFLGKRPAAAKGKPEVESAEEPCCDCEPGECPACCDCC